ncbi:hypothetical protein [Solicola sp. PLA-1-18]|uniref:hypothetical protein n=1 Tax=Solicola sp. PLA-1-18 TaxID=3380532 RepID=UPI003B814EB8
MSGGGTVAVLHLWGVEKVRTALRHMATDRWRLRDVAGLRFAKLMGTGSGETFTVRDADPHHWALLTTWDSVADAERFDAGRVVGGWDGFATERLTVTMRPLTTRGTWAGRSPFETHGPATTDGPVAALTRARLRPSRALTFWRAVPPVSADLARSPGLRMSVGVGEAPVGLQGTFSLWDSADDLLAFAYRSAPHLEAVRRTAEVGWYAEELFARFAVLGASGTYRGRTP